MCQYFCLFPTPHFQEYTPDTCTFLLQVIFVQQKSIVIWGLLSDFCRSLNLPRGLWVSITLLLRSRKKKGSHFQTTMKWKMEQCGGAEDGVEIHPQIGGASSLGLGVGGGWLCYVPSEAGLWAPGSRSWAERNRANSLEGFTDYKGGLLLITDSSLTPWLYVEYEDCGTSLR